MKLLSVIIPVYQVEDYLHECVESVMAQTYRHMEIILVDDGSPDHCPQLCDDYARQDSRIVVIHQQNQGLSAARNAGLDAAHGDYIGFVDSDDYISPDYFEEAIRTLEQLTDIDIVEMPLLSRFNTSGATRYAPTSDLVAHGADAAFALWFTQGGYLRAYSQTKVLRRRLLQDVRFPVGKTFEDLHIIVPLLKRCRGMAYRYHATAHYFYRWREDSITVQARWADFCSQLEALDHIAEVAEQTSSIQEAEHQAFTLTAANLMIDAARARRQEQKAAAMPTLPSLRAYIEKHRPTLRQLLAMPLNRHARIKNIPLAVCGLDAHVRLFA